MSGAGDYDTEMFRRSNLDDATFERLIAGQPVAGDDLLASFVEDTQIATASPAPQPSPALAAFLADDLSTEKGDLPVTAASNVPGRVQQAAGPPKWRKKNVIEVALAKLAALGLAAKVGVATGALALTGTAAAFSGALPDPVTDAIERTGIDIPGGRSAEHRKDAGSRQDAEHRPSDATEAGTPAQADFGTGVADSARSGAPQQDGRQFGGTVSTGARQTHQPAGTPTASSNPGTEYRDGAGTQQPSGTPTGDSNPGTEYRDGAGTQQPEGTPTADSNLGSEYRDSAGTQQPTSSGGDSGETGRRP